MRKTSWALYLWPGLPALWLDGSWAGLAVAAGFGAALNVLLAASYVWFELLAHGQLVAGWTVLGVVWLGAAMVSRRWRARRAALETASPARDLFQSALAEYLRGHWYDAEAAVSRLVAKNPKDVEARLLWATLLRRTRRAVESRAQLKQLERLDGAAEWREEISREWQALAVLMSQAAPPTPWLDSTARQDATRCAADARSPETGIPEAESRETGTAQVRSTESRSAETEPAAAPGATHSRAA